MNSLEMACAGIRARDEALRQALENPVRRHEAQGIAEHATSLKDEVFQALAEFAIDCCDPEALGHLAAPEIIVRAARCKKLVESLRPKVCERPSGVGYMEPPPARCQHCDES
jgi:hypothetical protein